MARIDMEKRGSGGLGWLWALIVLTLLAAFVWWMFFVGDKGGAEVGSGDSRTSAAPAQAPPATRQQPAGSAVRPTAGTGGGIIDVARINEDPASWAGQQVSGDLRVVDVPTDRTVYVEHEGERLVAVFHPVDVDDPPPEIADQVILRIRDGQLVQPAGLDALETSAPLDPASRSLLEEQAIFLVVNPEQVEMVAEVRTDEHLAEPR